MKAKKIRKQIIAVFIGIALVVSQLYGLRYIPVSAEPEPVASISNGVDVPVEYTSFEAALTNWMPGTTLKLMKDVVIDHSIVLENYDTGVKNYTLDLNNHGIRLDQAASGSVISFNNFYSYDCSDFSLNIFDNSNDGTVHYISLDVDGRGVDVSRSQPSSGIEGKDYIPVIGGYITGGDGVYGGGVSGDISNISIDGGCIVGNISSLGGGISVKNGRLSINDVSIVNNSVELCGGGVYILDTVFDMNGGIISNNISNEGGGIYIENGVDTTILSTIDAGSIEKNLAEDGGGIKIYNGNIVLGNTASVSHNIATLCGGGISSDFGTINMNGSSSITHNTVYDDGNDYYLYGGGIYLVKSDVTMNDSSYISYNSSDEYGGGIYACLEDSIIMNDSSRISYNSSLIAGGGIYANAATYIEMNNTTCISNNTSKEGGGICAYFFSVNGELNMNDQSSICQNMANESGGVYFYYGDIVLKGSASITENQALEEWGGLRLLDASLSISNAATIFDNVIKSKQNTTYPSNVCLDLDDGELCVDTHLSGKIGVSVTEDSEFVSEEFVTNNIPDEELSDADAECFISDSPDYIIVNNNGCIETVLNENSEWVVFQNKFLNASSNSESPTIIELGKDYISSPNSNPISIPDGTYAVIDLKGHKVDHNLTGFGQRENGTVIKVYGNLTIKDSSAEKSGKIIGGSSYYGGGIYVDYGAYLKMEDGTITGNNAFEGGGIYVNDATLIMTGNAAVIKNSAQNDGAGIVLLNNWSENLLEISGNATICDNFLDDAFLTPSNLLFLEENNNPILVTGPLTGIIGISTKEIESNEYVKKVGIVFAEADTSYNEGELTLCDAKAFVSDYYDYAVGIELQTYLGGLYLGTPITVEEISPMYYTGKELKPAVTVKSGNSELTDKNYGMLFFQNGTEVEQLVTPGKYTVTVIGTGIDAQNNYYGGIVDKEFVINKGKNKLTKEPSALQLTADGNDKALVSEGEAENGTVLYALGTDDISSPKEGFDKNVPKASLAGTYYVWYMVNGDDYYESTVPVCVVVTINRANPENPSGGDEEPENPSGGDKNPENPSGGGGNISNPNNNQGGGNGNISNPNNNQGGGNGNNGGSSNPTSGNGGNNGNGNGTGNGSGTPGNVDPLKPKIIKSETEELDNGDTVTTIIQQRGNIKEEIVTTKDKKGNVKSVKTTVKDSKDQIISETEKTITNKNGTVITETITKDKNEKGTIITEKEWVDKDNNKRTLTTTIKPDKTKEVVSEKVSENGNTYRSDKLYDENNNLIRKTVDKFAQTSNKTKVTHSVEDTSGAKKISTTSTYVSGNTIETVFNRKANGNGSYSYTKTIKDTGEVIVKNYGMAKNGNFTVKEITPNKDGVVNIPSSVLADGKKHKVTTVYKDAFKDNTEVTSVNFGKNIIKIGANAFAGATNLTNLTFKGKVEKIEQGAFDGVETLTIDLSYVKDQKELEAEIERLMGLFEASGAETKLKIISSKLESEKLEE